MKTIESNNQKAKIIENVKIRLADDGEIQVNVTPEIFSYYKNDTSYKNKFTNDGWYCVGTLGIAAPSGIIISKQKDTVTKLPAEETLSAADIKLVLEGKCHYISFTSIIGANGDNAIAILFPNKHFLSHPDYEISPMEGCFSLRELR